MSQALCVFFTKGTCKSGDRCNFSHSIGPYPAIDVNKPSCSDDGTTTKSLCKYWAKGTCKKGDSCSFSHIHDKSDRAITPTNPSKTDSHLDTLTSPTHTSVGSSPSCSDGPLQSENENFNEDVNISTPDLQQEIPEALDVFSRPFSPPMTRVDGDGVLELIQDQPDNQSDPEADPSPCALQEDVVRYQANELCKSASGTEVDSDESHSDENQKSVPPFPDVKDVPTKTLHWSEYADPHADPTVSFCKYFTQNRCPQGDACSFRHSLTVNEYALLFRDTQPYLWSPGTQRLRGVHMEPQGGSISRVCVFYPLGKCRNGDACTYLHVPPYEVATIYPQQQHIINGYDEVQYYSQQESAGQLPCVFFTEKGYCRNGDRCIYYHDGTSYPQPYFESGNEDKRVLEDNRNDANLHRSSRPCKWFREGRCFKGDGCNFLHSQADDASTKSDNGWGASTEGWGASAEGWGASAEGWGASTEGWGTKADPQDGPLEDELARQADIDATPLDEAITTYGGWDVPAADPWAQQVDTLSDDVPSKSKDELIINDGVQQTGVNVTPVDEVPQDKCDEQTDVHILSWDRAPSKPPSEVPSGNQDEWPVEEETEFVPWATSDPIPARCSFYARGHCKNGTRCHLRHEHADHSFSTDKTEVSADPLFQDDDLPEPVNDKTDPVALKSNGDTDTWNVDWPDEFPGPLVPVRIQAPCKAYGQGYCELGDSCRYLHINEADETQSILQEEEPTIAEHPGTPGEASVPDSEDDTPLVERLLFNCTVRFDPIHGCLPTSILTGSESCRVVLFNLPANILHDELHDLTKNFGNVEDIDIELGAETAIARIEFTELIQAAVAATQLNGQTYDSLPIIARLDSIAKETVVTPLVCHSVKVTWPVPSRFAWAFYPTITMAKKEEKRLDGLTFQGRKIKASFHRPQAKQTESFAVKIMGLSESVDNKNVIDLCTGSSLVTLGQVTYANSPVMAIRNLLANTAHLEFFDILPSDPSQTKNMAFAQFGSGLSKIMALHGVKQPFLGDGALSIQQVYHVRYNLSSRRFQVVQHDLDRLREMHQDCNIRVYNNTDPNVIHIYSGHENLVAFGQANKQLQSLLQGEVLECNGERVWDEYLDISSSVKTLEKINMDPSFFIKVDSRVQAIHIVGNEDSRQRARACISRLLQLVRSQQHVIPLDLLSLRKLLDGGLKAMQDNIGSNKLILDVTVPHLVVRGDPGVLNQVKSTLITSVPCSSPDITNNEDLCPVCYRKPEEPIKLYCEHTYCQQCLQYVLQASNKTCFMPPKCIAKAITTDNESCLQCPEHIPYKFVRDLLPIVDEASFLRSSFLTYVRNRPSEFFFCPSLGCETVYRPGREGSVYCCPECFTRVCSSCHLEYHEGTSCTISSVPSKF